MERRAISLVTLLAFFFAATPTVPAETAGDESVTVRAVHMIKFKIKKGVKGKCVVDFGDYAKPVEVDTGDLVFWEIYNDCGKARTVKLEFPESPLNQNCILGDSVQTGQPLPIICQVTKALNTGDKAKEYKYNIKGDFNQDPKLIVRPPGGPGPCKACRKLCP